MRAIAQALKADFQQHPKKPAPSPWILRAIFDAYPSAVAILDQSGFIIHTNGDWDLQDSNGFCGPQYSVGRNYFELCKAARTETPLVATDLAEGINRVIRGEQEQFLLEYDGLNPSRAVFIVQVRRLKSHGPTTYLLVSHQTLEPTRLSEQTALDRIKGKQVERETNEVNGRLIRVQEEERRRIARELHDDINQKLALLSIELEQLSVSPALRAGELRKRAKALQRRAQELSFDIHRISYNLHPSKLDHLGLVAALRSLCQEVSDHCGLQIDFTSHDIPVEMPRDVSLSLYRVVQEALRNVSRHSGSATALVELFWDTDCIKLRVTDSGSGFESGNAKSKPGLGLISMQERLRLVGGDLLIRSRPSRGAQIEARVPLNSHS